MRPLKLPLSAEVNVEVTRDGSVYFEYVKAKGKLFSLEPDEFIQLFELLYKNEKMAQEIEALKSQSRHSDR